MKILVMCTANSCRSQMAEAWARHLFPADWDIQSAGLVTSPISIKTREAMEEVGIDMAGQYSKTIDDFELDRFDWILTFSAEAAEFLPELKDPKRHRHLPVVDPTGRVGRPEVIRAAYATARDEIGRLLKTFLLEQTPGSKD